MPTVVFISGEPGMGKTTLVSSFLEEVRVSQDALILRGRCNEREDVPFNAFDALVDDLSRYLRLLPDAETSELLPRDVFALVQLFPVLNRVPAIERAPLHLVNDRSELRTRAFDAFRELIARIGDRRFTCILIDDLQWVDQDSLPLLRSLLVDPEPAPVMLVLSRRSDSREDSDLVSIRHLVDSNSAMESFDLEVAPLTQEDSRALALSELPSGTKDSEALARSIAEEAGGSPLFIQALASSHGMLSGGTSSFDELLNAHRHALQPEARRLLEMVALLGRPVALRPLLSASGAERGVVDQLQAGRLLRADRKSTTVELECYHDRIRESVTAQLSEQERSEHYRYLATALSDSRDSDPELLADCFEGSGQFAEGARSAAMAAARAEQGMAFEKAARLYQRALQLALPSDGQRREHLVSMAEALGNAGRSDAAADAYLQAAALTQGEEAVEWRRRAAFELLTGGYAERGETLIRRVCQEVGIRIPANHRVAVTRYLILQGALRWAKVPPPAAPLRPLTRAQELKLNVAWTATFLSVDDPILGLWAGAQYLREALSAKEPRHIAMALTVEGFNTTMVTPRSEARIAELFAAGESYSRMLGDTALLGALSVNQGVGFIFGRAMSANRGREYLRSGLEQLRGTRGNRVYIDSANMYLMLCPSQDLAYEARRCTLLVEEAFSLKRLWSARHMAVMSVFTRLLVDDYDGVAQHVALASAAWTPERSAKWFDLTMFQALVTMAHYRGDPEVTLHQAERLWPIYEGSGVQKSIIGAALMHAHRGAAAVWVARRPGTSAHRRSGLLRMARRDLRRLSRTPFHPYSGLELAIKTGLALAEGHTDQALALFKQYVDTGKSSPLWAESETYAARRAIGLLIGGAQGEEIVNSAERSLRELGVRKIAASCQMLLPGCHLSIEG